MRRLLFFLVLALAVFLRFYQLNKVPPALFSDEVDLGYQVYSLIKTGHDYFGNPWPTSFHSFADFRAPLYLYSAVSTIALFGLNEWGVRIPAAFFGVLGIAAFFILVKELTRNFNFSLLAALVLTILPWHLHYSRAGFEATLIFFLVCLGLFFFFRALRKKSFLLFGLSGVVLGSGFYAYATARLFLPLLALVAIVIFRKEVFGFGLKKVIGVTLLGVLVLLPFTIDFVRGNAGHRFSYINIFSDPNLKFEINRQRLVDSTHGKVQAVGMKTTLSGYVFHNKPLSWFLTATNNYLSSFSSEFLFLKGDPNPRHGVGKAGGLLAASFFFLLVGLVRAFVTFKQKGPDILGKKETAFFLAFLFLAPIPSSITFDGGVHATRLFLMVLPLVLLTALGIWEFVSWFSAKRLACGLVLILFLVNFGYWLHLYYYHYPVESGKYWHYGLKEGVQKLESEALKFDKVILSDSYEPTLIFYLFWSRFDPHNFNANSLEWVNNDWFVGRRLGKYYFGKIQSDKLKEKETEKILILAGRNDFGADLENGPPPFFKVIDKVRLLSGEPLFYLLDNEKTD